MSLVEKRVGDFAKIIEFYKNDIATLKTGRANPAILDGITVESYGAFMPINQLASISVPEARSIVIQPWDKSVLGAIEKAIASSDLGLNPVNEGERIRITMPLMTEESRKEIVKLLNKKTEESRISIRHLREEIKEGVVAAEKNKEFGEDERYTLLELLEKKVAEFNEKLKKIEGDKEKEIMTV